MISQVADKNLYSKSNHYNKENGIFFLCQSFITIYNFLMRILNNLKKGFTDSFFWGLNLLL